MAKFFHVTHRKNVDSIREKGLLASKAMGRTKSVWFCTKSWQEWALAHVAIRHKWKISDLVIISIEWAVPDQVKTGMRGRWRTREGVDIPPEAIGDIATVEISHFQLSKLSKLKKGNQP
jgi:hypothetical protein